MRPIFAYWLLQLNEQYLRKLLFGENETLQFKQLRFGILRSSLYDFSFVSRPSETIWHLRHNHSQLDRLRSYMPLLAKSKAGFSKST